MRNDDVRRDGAALAVAALVLSLAVPAGAQQRKAEDGSPLSAIEWLSDSVTYPLPPPRTQAAPRPPEPDVATSASPGDVSVIALGRVTPDAAGLLPTSVTGLPRHLWGATGAASLAGLIRGERADMVPALQDLLMQLLLAEVDAPFDADARGVLFLARIDKLIELGALDQAGAMLNRVGHTLSDDIFARAMDVALLTGDETEACAELGATPALTPDYPTRIFCQARNGDWDTAALTLGTARALGYITDAEDALLSRFLDPGLYEGEPMPQLKGPMTPLRFRLFEGVGEPPATGPLPRAFAYSDLSDTAGWKAQLEAAERLVRSGALDPVRLMALYDEGKPAASGGVWERAAAVQALDEALEDGDPRKVGAALGEAWDRMAKAELEPALARVYGPKIAKVDLTGGAAALAFRLALLTKDYETAALAYQPQTAKERFLVALARGEADPGDAPDAVAAAAAQGFTRDQVPIRVRTLVQEKRIGEAILRAMDLVTLGATGEMDELTDGLALLRSLGLEDTARRAALELVILDRRG